MWFCPFIGFLSEHRCIEWHMIKPSCGFQIIWSCLVEHGALTLAVLTLELKDLKNRRQAAAVLRLYSMSVASCPLLILRNFVLFHT